MSLTRVEELIEEFDWYDGVYKHHEMEEAFTLREEITPHLIRILEEVADDPAQYASEEHYANVYAAALLAHFQEPAAHLPIIRAFLIPEEQREILWGGIVTETLPALLLQTCNGELAAIRELILDREAPEYVRSAAVEALTYAVVQGMAGREEVIAFLSSLLTGTEAEADSYFWGDIVCAISDLHPRESMEAIRKAFEDGLVETGYVDLVDIERDLACGREKMLADLQNMAERRIPRDIHDYLSWFACFQEEAPLPPRQADYACRAQQTKKKKSRAKNKLAKKARKKNRR
jgi:hypothetical protein